MDFIATLEQEFLKTANATIAKQQKQYMRNKFEYFGYKSAQRRIIQKPFLDKKHLPNKENLSKIVTKLWNKPQRDFHYFAQELVAKYKLVEKDDILLYEYMITHNSWWDTVDFIASTLVGNYFKLFPEKQKEYIDKWLNSSNIWLQRTCLIYQLKYKENVDTTILLDCIKHLHQSNEFFIRKAIGWSLRQYSRVNPELVLNVVETIPLSNLSRREAIRLIKND